MAVVPSGIIFPFNGAHATSHTGWSRKTSLDGQHIHVATGDTAGTTGGSATHTHTETGHTHTFSAGASSGTNNHQSGSIQLKTPTAASGHTHGSATSNTGTATIDAANNAPPYFTVIFKESAGTNGIPDGFWAFFDSATLPTNWSASATPLGYFLKGAATGANGGSSGGSGDHVHTQQAHSHAAKASAAGTGATNTDAGSNLAAAAHTHNVTLNNYTAADLTTADLNPAYDTLLVIENDTGGEDLPVGVIGLWLSTIATIPSGWIQKTLDSGNDFIMCSNDSGDIGATGGGRTHTHSATAHSAHTTTQGTASATRCNHIADVPMAAFDHVHTWTIGSATQSINYCSSRAAYPPYTEVLLVKYTGSGLRLLASTGVGV